MEKSARSHETRGDGPRNVTVRLRRSEPWGTVFKGQESRSHGKKRRRDRGRVSGVVLILKDGTCGRHC